MPPFAFLPIVTTLKSYILTMNDKSSLQKAIL